LSGRPDDLAYNSWWGFGSQEGKDTPFIVAVKKKAKELHLVYNSFLKGAEWSAVELKGGKPVAFYMDLNADGKLSDDEKMLPVKAEESSPSNRQYDFVTPDFSIKGNAGQELPFRLLMTVRFYGQDASPNCMWSPSCVMEGEADFLGQRTKLVLFTPDFSGNFGQFGRGAYAFLTETPKPGAYVPRETLSSVVNYEGQFYRVRLQGSESKGKRFRAVLIKDSTPVGELAAHVNGKAGLKFDVNSLSLIGAEDDTVAFDLGPRQSKLPAGAYKITRGYIRFGSERNDEWSVDFQDGPKIAIDPGSPVKVVLGKPVVTVKAIDEKERYSSEAKDQAIYRRGATIYLSRVVRGEGGEAFGRFSQKTGQQMADKKPQIKILKADGDEVLRKDMEYG
jgi:hypothetical protein